MIRIKMERGMKKKRTENWTPDEKKLLRRLLKDNQDVIDSKNNTSSANFLKTEAWKRIWEKFVVQNRRPRTLKNLRDQWKNMKAREILKQKGFERNEKAVDEDSDHSSDHNDDPLAQETNISDEEPLKQFKCVRENYNESRDMSQNESPKPRHVVTQMFQKHKGGIEYKRSLLELNKVVKEQITNCAIEEHTLRMRQLKEEHQFRMKNMNELHQLECDNKRLQAQLMTLDIEIKKKQLNSYVL